MAAVNVDFKRMPQALPLVVVPSGINIGINIDHSPTPAPTPIGFVRTTRFTVVAEPTPYVPATHRPLFAGPTPPGDGFLFWSLSFLIAFRSAHVSSSMCRTMRTVGGE